MARLKKDYVVQYFNSWIEYNPTICYIQMELCFCSLGEVLEQSYSEFHKEENEMINHIEYYFKCELFKEILEGVNYLHTLETPIIHQDLKPNNILITDGSNISRRFIKIADFGSSTFQKLESTSNSTESPREGTYTYTAPEVMEGKEYDTSADIYSLGMIAQKMFKIDAIESTK
jgi:serine/threonine protein kinase